VILICLVREHAGAAGLPSFSCCAAVGRFGEMVRMSWSVVGCVQWCCVTDQAIVSTRARRRADAGSVGVAGGSAGRELTIWRRDVDPRARACRSPASMPAVRSRLYAIPRTGTNGVGAEASRRKVCQRSVNEVDKHGFDEGVLAVNYVGLIDREVGVGEGRVIPPVREQCVRKAAHGLGSSRRTELKGRFDRGLCAFSLSWAAVSREDIRMPRHHLVVR
jgi:hypothetical protein